ncbi:tetratricopeptide repeat protein [Nitrosomonas sp.]|uniref:tetratricopeptide repeat protein n=1 Tax=Nitrosomonas sp. TaxID=42353 RepID=UPI00283C5575|nr:tetratricopeptide repeat protein [Nitrosomonas sp.]MDR4513086.1 tetratricopeptide repeat protein [Nitrosomonas sp.]
MDKTQVYNWLVRHSTVIITLCALVTTAFLFWPAPIQEERITQNNYDSARSNQIIGKDNSRIEIDHIGDKHYHTGSSVEDAMKLAEQLAAKKGEQDAQIIKSLQETILALTKQNANQSDIQEALDLLAQGETEKAEEIFTSVAEQARHKGKQASIEEAKALRHLGSLAFLHDTQKAFDAYKRSTELEPENPDGWNQLGHLYQRVGELENAEYAYLTALKFVSSDQLNQAVVYNNLGIVYRIRGDLDRAINYHEQALTKNREFRHKTGMARDYGNLGLVYATRGDLDRTIDYYKKALAIDYELRRKEGMANQHTNLGIIYYTRGDLDTAIEHWEKSLIFYTEIGVKPRIEQIQFWLDEIQAKQSE